MSLALATCMICQKLITRQFLVCRDCEERWDLTGSSASWPRWAKRMFADHWLQRYHELQRLENEGDSKGCAAYLEFLAYGDFVEDNR